MKSKKGITLTLLVLMVIVIIILGFAITFLSITTANKSRENIMKAEINKIQQKAHQYYLNLDTKDQTKKMLFLFQNIRGQRQTEYDFLANPKFTTLDGTGITTYSLRNTNGEVEHFVKLDDAVYKELGEDVNVNGKLSGKTLYLSMLDYKIAVADSVQSTNLNLRDVTLFKGLDVNY